MERDVADVPELRGLRLEQECRVAGGGGDYLKRSTVGPHALALINTLIGWHSRCRQEHVR